MYKLQKTPSCYFKCLAFLAKRNVLKIQIQLNTQVQHFPPPQTFSVFKKVPHQITSIYVNKTQAQGLVTRAAYANVTAEQTLFSRTLTLTKTNINETLNEVKSLDIDLFLRIIELIQKHYKMYQ